MKIAYLLAEDLSKHPGLKHKIEGQIRCWEEEGHDVYKVLHYSGVVLDPKERVIVTNSTLAKPLENITKMTQLRRLGKQYTFICDVLGQIEPDLTYSRYLYPALGLQKLSQNSGKLIFEINSDDKSEYATKSNTTGLFNKLFRSYILRKADGFVFVTNELKSSLSFQSFSQERITIANGIDYNDFDFINKTNNIVPHLCFIGSPNQAWHGLDKLKLLFEALPECIFHIIGSDRKECEYRWGQVPDNVNLYGYLNHLKAQQVVSKCDIGISTLALHRKKMHEACPLKVRQYLAHGLPIIAASEDTDLLVGKHNFYFQLPNCEENIYPYREQIRSFVTQVFSDDNLRKKVRNFAVTYLATDKKEAARLRFFERLVKSA